MSEDQNLPIKEAITVSIPVVKALVDTFLLPKLEKLKSKILINNLKRADQIEEYFSEYFNRSYEKYSVLNTLVFSNTEKLLKNIYIPLSITEIPKRDKKPLTFVINGFPYALGKKHKSFNNRYSGDGKIHIS